MISSDPHNPLTLSNRRPLQIPDGRGRLWLGRIALMPALAGASLLALSAAMTGCAASPSQNQSDYASGAMSERAGRNADRPSAALEEVERQYLIGPTAAREMGFRIDWQFSGGSTAAKLFEIDQDSVFLLDSRNILTRLDRARGSRVWSLPVAEQVLDIQGISYVPEAERVYLTAGGGMLVLDAANGSQVGRQRLAQIANTAPARFGQFLIYGSRSGQIIWHSFPIGFQWNGYKISHSINVPPVIVGNLIVTVGNDGRLSVLHATNATMRWDKRLIAPVVSKPTVADGAVFVSSLDQHIWAYDLDTGRSLWRYLADSPLSSSPAVVGSNLYQQIPGEGLVAFVAQPVNRPGGQVLWKAPDVRGNVIGGRQGRVFVWNERDRRLAIVDERSGGVISTINLPRVHQIRVAGRNMDELYAFGDEGRIIRLLAR